MWFAAAHHTEVATWLSMLWVAVSLAVQSVLWHLPTGVLQKVVKFQEQALRCLCLETFGLRICGLILGLVGDWVHLAIRLEEAAERLQILQDEHQAHQNLADLIEARVNAVAVSGVC
jgi:hypothetical protein